MRADKKRKLKKAGFAAGALCLVSIGGVSSYLTDFDRTDNQFTVGRVSIELEEPDFKPEEQKKIEPGKDVKKDPQIKNTGVTKEQELFSFRPSEDWTELSVRKTGDNQIYVYAYNEILKPEQTTEALFESVKFLNIIEGQLDEQTLSIPIRAYAIQTSYTGGEAQSVIDQARTAYEKYVNQNKDKEGGVTS